MGVGVSMGETPPEAEGRCQAVVVAEAGPEAMALGSAAREGCRGDPAPLGLRVCSVRSVDGSPTTAFTVLECEGSRRLGSRPRRYLLTGQANGSLAMWDLTTAMDGLGQAPGTPCPPRGPPWPPTPAPALCALHRSPCPPQSLAQ